MTSHDDFIQQLRATFVIEAQEHVAVVAAGLQKMASPGEAHEPQTLEAMFRAAHSLKGAARAVECVDIETTCQLLEDIFAHWRGHSVQPAQQEVDTLLQTLDTLAVLLAGDMAMLSQPSAALARQREPLRQLAGKTAPCAAAIGMSRFLSAPASDGVQSPAPAALPGGEDAAADTSSTAAHGAKDLQAAATVRVSSVKLESQVELAEDMLPIKIVGAQRLADWQAVAVEVQQWQQEYRRIEGILQQLRHRRDADSPLARIIGFLDWTREYMNAHEQHLTDTVREVRRMQDDAARRIDRLRYGARELFALPFSSIAASFPMMVRDLCREQSKQAQLILRGEAIEVDKRILQEIKDPLLHLLRNAVDHGVEGAMLRRARNKPPVATIVLEVSNAIDQMVRIVLSDDGNGLDAQALRRCAVAAGLLDTDASGQLDDPAAHALAFASGLSTSRAVTTVSGRGLGLAIVREKIEHLGGNVQVHSSAGEGTRFVITLPLHWVAFRGVLVVVGGHRFLIPTTAVRKVIRIRQSDVHTVEGCSVVTLNGQTMPFASVAQVLDLPATPRDEADLITLAVLVQGTQNMALAIDSVEDEREVLLQPLAPPLMRVRHIAAMAVLGSGELVPILNAGDLLRHASRIAPMPAETAAIRESPRSRRTILVAEDSITSRSLLRSILESAGYDVVTAVDGLDAWVKLPGGGFDLLVSDVDMPNLNGFELTRRIRADQRLQALPIILVTTLQQPEDREQGLQAGANAYITKGGFDQNHLIEAIARLV
ncbi:hybrid sensor histidine kinase/response regulator [Brenneria goodwinii]|uniref:hybrid sensor histidine kinase/response regulator n=1 Tax=Brenneria goodwinii TaxID=1109412 RepID=UPI0036EB7A84